MKYCPKCGNQMDDEALFCSKCGNKFEKILRENTHKKTPKLKKKKFDSFNIILYATFFGLALFAIFNLVCFHDWTEATCTEAKTCLSCGKVVGEPIGHTWIEANCEKEKYCESCKKSEGEPLGHEFVEITCVDGGYCSLCGKKGIPSGHDWQDATCYEAKHCSVCKETEGEPLEHTWVEATCEVARTCSLCGKIEGEALGHTWIEPTCTEQKTCSICNKKEGKALGHAFGDWKVSNKATCGSDGTEKAVCSVCKEEKTRKISKTNEHTYGDWKVRNEPTCTVNGAKIKTCTICKQQKVEGIPYTGHDFIESIIEEATYYEPGTKGQKCSKCGSEAGITHTYHSFYKTKLSSIFSEYRNNEIAADEKYDDMYIEFTATIREIEASGSLSTLFSNYGTIKFEISNGTWLKDEAHCEIKSKEQFEIVKTLSVGTKITIRGKIDYDSDLSSYRILYIDIIEIV